MPAVPLLMRYGRELGRVGRVCGWCVVGVSVAVQAASLAFWLRLEIYQIERWGMMRGRWRCGSGTSGRMATGQPMPAGIDLPGACRTRGMRCIFVRGTLCLR